MHDGSKLDTMESKEKEKKKQQQKKQTAFSLSVDTACVFICSLCHRSKRGVYNPFISNVILEPFRCVTGGKKGRLPTVKLEIHKVLLSKQTTNKNSTKRFSRKRYQNNALGDMEETAVCQIVGRIPVGETNGQGFIV